MRKIDQVATVLLDDAIVAVVEELCVALALSDHPMDPEVEVDLLPGADSVRLTRAVAALERRYGIEFDDQAIRSATTIREWALVLIDACRRR